MVQLENDRECFSWLWLFENGKLNLQNLCHFKEHLLFWMSEEEWKIEVEKHYKYMGEEKVKEYVKECEEYCIKHKEEIC